MSAASNFTIRRGEPPADQAEQNIKDVQYWQLGVITSYAITTREMLQVSGLLTKNEEEQVEKAMGVIMGLLELKYQAVIDGELSERSDKDFFKAAQKPSPRVLRRRAYYFSNRDSNSKPKPIKAAPGAETLNDYYKHTLRLKQSKFED